jgi:hypothetical protein
VDEGILSENARPLVDLLFQPPLSARQVVKGGHPIVKTVPTEFQVTNEKIENTKS